MKYLLDAHALSNAVIGESKRRDDLFIVEDVLSEWANTDAQKGRVTNSFNIIPVSYEQLVQAQNIMEAHGDNLKLVQLYNDKGTGDIMMLAHVLNVREKRRTALFEEEMVIVTKDAEVKKVAAEYQIKTVEKI
jgi:hypothetical protein